MAVGQVGLQHDAGLELGRTRAHRARVVNAATVRCRSRYSSMSRLTNPCGSFANAGSVDLAERLADALDAAIEVECVEVGDQSGGLDRDRIDVGTAQLSEHLIDAAPGFVIAQNRLTERVDEQADSLTSALSGVSGERRILCGQHNPFRLSKDSPPHERHHNLRQQWCQLGADRHQHTVGMAERPGQTMFADHIGKSPRGAAVRLDAQDLVSQSLHELAAGGIGHQQSESPQLPAFAPR